MSHSEKHLQENIVDEKFMGKIYFYSLVQKAGNTFTFINKNRLLIYSQDQGFITYVEEQKTPFQVQNKLPVFNKDKADLMASFVFHKPKTNLLSITYPTYNEKKEKVMVKWEFIMKSVGIADKWFDFLTKEKQSKAKGVSSSNANLTAGILMNKTKQEKEDQNHESFFLRNSGIKKNKQDDERQKELQREKQRQRQKQIERQRQRQRQSERQRQRQRQLERQRELQKEREYKRQQQREHESKFRQEKKQQEIRRNFQSGVGRQGNSRTPYSNLRDSKIKPKNQSALKNDWNYKFIKNPTLETIFLFEKNATEAFLRVYDKDKEKQTPVRSYQVEDLLIKIANNFTKQGKQLKKQFRNYHYIMDCLKGEPIIGVPLSALIEYKGVVCLVKSQFPPECEAIKNLSQIQTILKSLQIVTKIHSSILYNSGCVAYDLTEIYGSVGEYPRIFIDNLVQYMTQLGTGSDAFFIRPQLIQYNIRNLIPGGNLEQTRQTKTKNQMSSILDKEIRQLVNYLSEEDIYITNIFDLKEYMHEQGINMKYLLKVFAETKNRFVKKYIQTCLVAKIAKDDIVLAMKLATQNDPNTSLQRLLQNKIKFLIEGKSVHNNEEWKKLAVQFRKKYSISLNTHELEGGFFLSCLMTLVHAEYQTKKIDKSKIVFQDSQIISDGFVRKLIPKAKSYYRLSSEAQKITDICKFSDKDEKIYKNLVTKYDLKNRKVPEQFQLNNGKLYILAYLSQFAAPPGMGNKQLASSSEIYKYVNYEPPSTPTLKITLNYLIQCVENNENDEFQKCMKTAQDIIHYWLGYEHPQICQFYGCLSDYEWKRGETEESIRILEKILKISSETEGQNKKKIGLRLHALGERQLKSGRKKEAMQNLKKSKAFLEETNERLIEYPVILMKISSLYLNAGDISSCISYGTQSITSSEGLEINENYIIKTYEILCRAYEISGDKDELKRLALKCGKNFNNTKKANVFNDMVKIGLTGTIAKLSKEKTGYMLKLVKKMEEDGDLASEEESLSKLMELANSMLVMEKFILRSEAVEKLWFDVTNGRKIGAENVDYLKILAFISGNVGVDFIEGLVLQKDYE